MKFSTKSCNFLILEAEALYQSVLREHSKNPRNHGPLPGANLSARTENALCGDEVVLQFKLEEDGTVTELRFDGESCSLCRASASILTELFFSEVPSRRLPECLPLLAGFEAVLQPEVNRIASPEKLKALGVVKNFPQRKRCITLPWETLRKAMEEADRRRDGSRVLAE